MIQFLWSVLLAILVNIIMYGAHAQVDGVDYHWELKKSKAGVDVFVSDVSGSKFRAVRSTMRVKTTLNALVGLVHDGANCSRWADMCKEEIIVKKMGPGESLIYAYSDIRFPVADRDVVAHVVWTHDLANKRISMTSTATNKPYKKSKAVRIQYAVANWHFTELQSGDVLIESFAHVDPNGPIPAWMTHLMLVNSPIKTMMQMRKRVLSGDYNNFEPDFLVQKSISHD